jgi:type II secretory pathway component GspD/PulD (secretin)
MIDAMLRSSRAVVLLTAIVVTGFAESARADSVDDQLDGAAVLLEDGRVIAAKDSLIRLREAVDEEQRERLWSLLNAAENRLRNMSEAEISLQKAELALERGDLRLADLHANAVRTLDGSTSQQRIEASDLLDRAALMRDELAPMIPAAIEQAVRDFQAGSYAEAKAGFASVSRSGVPLSSVQTTTVRRYQERIYKLEKEQGTFEMEYVPLGVLRSASGTAVTGVVAVEVAQAEEDEPADEPMNGDELFEAAQRADAQRMLTEANAAYDGGRLATAQDLYLRLTTNLSNYLAPADLAQANERLREVRARLGAEAGLLGNTIGDRQVLRQQYTAEVENLIRQAETALSEGATDDARGFVAQAKLRWQTGNREGLFSDEEFRATLNRIDGLDDRIRTRGRELDEQEQLRRADELRLEQEAAVAAAEEERSARISENLQRLRALQAEQKYEEALQVVEEILFLDETNPAALLMQDILTDIIIYREWEEIRRQQVLGYTRESLAIQDGKVIPRTEISYPDDWPEISVRRGQVQSFVESEVDRQVLATLETRRIPANFQDNSLEDVLAFVATVTNLNLDVDWDSLDQIGIERDTRVSLELREVEARIVLDRILEKVSLDDFNKAGWAIQDGILVIASDDDLRKNTFIVIYDVRDLLFEVPDFDQVPELDLESALDQSNSGQGGGGGGGRGGGIFDDPENTDDAFPDEQEQLDRLLEIIQTNVDFDGWRDNGGDTGIVQVLNGNLIITNTARNHRDIQALLDKLREIRSLQITVEARILQVSTEFFEQIGFDLDIFFNAQNNQYDDVIAQLAAQGVGGFAGEGFAVTPSGLRADSPQARAGQTGATNTVTQFSDDGQGGFAFQDNDFAVTAPDGFSIIPVEQNSLGITDTLIASATALATTITNTNPALGVSGTFLDDIQVDFLIEATQADTRSVVLNAPRLTFTNGKAANIFVNNQRSYISGLTPVVGTSSVAFDPQTSVLNTGFSLIVRGVVSADRRYVTLGTQISIAELIEFRSVEQSAAVGGTGGTEGGTTATGTIQLPEIFVTRVQTGVTVPDKGTILLGGQRVTTEVDVETGVPVLSKIPIINRFFTNTATAKEESTLLILMKPKILIQSEQEEDAFPGLQDSLDSSFGF